MSSICTATLTCPTPLGQSPSWRYPDQKGCDSSLSLLAHTFLYCGAKKVPEHPLQSCTALLNKRSKQTLVPAPRVAYICRCFAGFGPGLLEFGPIVVDPGRLVWSSLAELGRILAENGPKLAEVGPKVVSGAMLVETGPALMDSECLFGRMWPSSGRTWPSSGQTRLNSGQSWSFPGQC